LSPKGLSVAVLAGGPSAEAAVSRVSAEAVCKALGRSGHEAVVLEVGPSLPGQLLSGSEARPAFDVAFPVAHGRLGEDGGLQGLLEVLGLPYVGSQVLASALGASKPHAKLQFERWGLPTAQGLVVKAQADSHAAAREVWEKLGRSVVIKPAGGGSAIGVTRLAEDSEDNAFVSALEQASLVDDAVLVERRVFGHEVTCGVLENEQGVPEALPPTLIVAQAADFYDFRSRYAQGGSRHLCPAPLPERLLAEIQRVAVLAHQAIGARDLSRADFVVAETDQARPITLLEVNTLPGMTPVSLFPEACAVFGLSFEVLVDRLARRAWSRRGTQGPREVPMPG
jgi:D-alanine-D-alanine ligase